LADHAGLVFAGEAHPPVLRRSYLDSMTATHRFQGSEECLVSCRAVVVSRIGPVPEIQGILALRANSPFHRLVRRIDWNG
jgi:hypothetical protein